LATIKPVLQTSTNSGGASLSADKPKCLNAKRALLTDIDWLYLKKRIESISRRHIAGVF
jgi:hypothetical protein